MSQTQYGSPRKHELWSVWRRLVAKCHDPRNPQYVMWGALGFSVTERWRGPSGFWAFVEDIPERPHGKNKNGRSSWRLELVYGTEFNGQSCRWAPARKKKR